VLCRVRDWLSHQHGIKTARVEKEAGSDIAQLRFYSADAVHKAMKRLRGVELEGQPIGVQTQPLTGTKRGSEGVDDVGGQQRKVGEQACVQETRGGRVKTYVPGRVAVLSVGLLFSC
jgi:hypothetical protein